MEAPKIQGGWRHFLDGFFFEPSLRRIARDKGDLFLVVFSKKVAWIPRDKSDGPRPKFTSEDFP